MLELLFLESILKEKLKAAVHAGTAAFL